MIFDQDRVSYNDFGDCHDEIATAGVNFIGRQPIVAFIYKGRVLLGAPYEDNDSGSSISSSMVLERNLSSRGDESAAYIVPNSATTNDAFWTSFKALDLAACPMF
jgi:hypothetical protein